MNTTHITFPINLTTFAFFQCGLSRFFHTIDRLIIMHPLFIRSDDRLMPKNHLDAPTRADFFSSSVSSLGTYLADTCDKARSAVKTHSACRLAVTGTNSCLAHRLPTIAFDDVLDGQSLFFILAWRSSTMRTVCQPITKSAVQLVHKLFSFLN